jgi:hypothetical protein
VDERARHVERTGEMRNAAFWLENLKGREELGVDGRIILKWILGKEWEGVDWMKLARERDQWRAVVNTVMNLRVP